MGDDEYVRDEFDERPSVQDAEGNWRTKCETCDGEGKVVWFDELVVLDEEIRILYQSDLGSMLFLKHPFTIFYNLVIKKSVYLINHFLITAISYLHKSRGCLYS